MFKFIQRLLVAWRLTRDVKLMAVVQAELADRAFHEGLAQRAGQLTRLLVGREAQSIHRPYEVVLQVKNVVSPQEMLRDAKTILEESRVEKTTKLPTTGRMALNQPVSFDQAQAFAEHNKKFA